MRKQVPVVFQALPHMAVCHSMLHSPHQEVVRLGPLQAKLFLLLLELVVLSPVVPVTLQVKPMQGVKLKDKTVVFIVLPSLEYVR
jgi:hypothetical protein